MYSHIIRCFVLFGFFLRKSRLETLDASGAVNQFCFAREKRMASRTDLHVRFFFGGADGCDIPAGAFNLGLWKIFGMNIGLHSNHHKPFIA